jgi:hypothetical protein
MDPLVKTNGVHLDFYSKLIIVNSERQSMQQFVTSVANRTSTRMGNTNIVSIFADSRSNFITYPIKICPRHAELLDPPVITIVKSHIAKFVVLRALPQSPMSLSMIKGNVLKNPMTMKGC